LYFASDLNLIKYHSVQRQILELLEGWLRHKSDMVNFEAARAICEMKNVTAAQLTKPIAGKLFLNSL
jgi:coatomer subunit gamma